MIIGTLSFCCCLVQQKDTHIIIYSLFHSLLRGAIQFKHGNEV